MKLNIYFHSCVFLIYCSILNTSTANEIYFDQVEIVPSYLKDFYNITEVRIAKFNRTTSVLNFRGDFYIDVDKDFEVEVTYHYNRFNNNQYNKMPMGIPRLNLCDILDKHYAKFFMNDLKGISNSPQLKSSEKFCPRKKVRYNSFHWTLKIRTFVILNLL